MRNTESKSTETGAAQQTDDLPAPVRISGRDILRDLLKGLLFIALVATIKFGVEHTSFGRDLERAGYDFLQRRLSPDYLPVVVLDISDLQPAPFNLDGVVGMATPRDHLQQLLQAVAEQDVKAVAIDIDFSPERTGYVTPRDPEFFQFCLDLRERTAVPVILGISRTESLPRSRWLGAEDYASLAGSISIPRHDTRRMLRWIQADAKSEPGPTLASALAERFQVSQSKLLGWLHALGLVQQVSEKELEHGVHVGDFPVDYSSLDSQMNERTLRTINPDVVRDQGHRLRGKIVILGRGALGRDDADRFNVAGWDQEIPGVFLHASATSTLSHSPLYELTPLSRLSIDFILSCVILISVIFIRISLNRHRQTVSEHALQIVLTWLVVITSLILGVMLVGKTRLMWSDFVLVLGALVLHPYIEQFVSRKLQAAKRLPQIVSKLFERKERVKG